MDAKSKAEFINSVANEQEIVCNSCGASNKAGSKFCVTCGNKFTADEKTGDSTPAFASVEETSVNTEAEVKPVQETVVEKYVEPKNVFAQGLPAWSIEPPQVMVRRR